MTRTDAPMRQKPSRMLVLVFSFLSTASFADAQTEGSNIYNQISALFNANKVSRVSIIHVPSYIETRTRINQQALRQLSPFEFSFTKPREGAVLDRLETSLDELKAATPEPEHEVRWGILFFDAGGKEQMAIFLDATGQFIQVGEVRLRAQGKALACIRNIMQRVLR